MNTTTQLTWRDGVEAIDTLVSAELDKQEYPQEAVANAIVAMTKNLQHRDYFLGLAKCDNLEVMTSVAVRVINQVDNEIDKVPFYTCLSAFYYELGATESAKEALSFALQLNADYGLAKLLYRVIEAGWDNSAMAKMRKELHPKVIEGLDSNADTPITEGGN
jgi:hypothetical protein